MRIKNPVAALLVLSSSLVIVACGSTAPNDCNSNSECPAGQRCVRNECEPNPTSDAGRIPCNPGTVCRSSAGPCDVEELCGADGFCPDDAFKSGDVCRAPAGPCDLDERCPGDSAECPADLYAPNTTVCRSAAGLCDKPETCNGVTTECPADQIAALGDVCRPAAGLCDLPETCDGATTFCPTDAKVAANTTCRGKAGECDVAEVCNGTDAQCPVDAVRSNGASCRAAVSTCDVEETCNGSSAICPDDAFQPANTPCANPSCSSGYAIAAGYCVGGSATCNQGTPVSCNGYQCSGDTCGINCASDNNCLTTHYCKAGGQCAPKKQDGEVCSSATSGNECVSGICKAFYVDSDGDGYGTAQQLFYCGSSPKAGVSSNVSGDCCDSDARAKPGAGFQTSARTGCGGYDFNCDGATTLQFPGSNACTSSGSCGTGDRECLSTSGWTGNTPSCGTTASWSNCNATSTCNGQGSYCTNVTTSTETQGCK